MAEPRTGARRGDRARLIAFLTLFAVLAAAVAWFLARNLERREERVWVGYQGEARTDAFLAAQRLLSRLGRDTHAIEGLPVMSTLGARDALLLPRRNLRLTPGQVKAITDWVAHGGLLVAEGTYAEDPDSDRESDPLFQAFGVRMVRNGLKAPVLAPGEELDAFRDRQTAFDRAHGVVELQLNDWAGRADLGAYTRLESTGPEEDHGFQGDAGDGPKVRFLRRGKGTAFLFTELWALSNRYLDQDDHADLLAALVSKRPATAKVWIVYQEAPPSLLAWLKAKAWMVLAALGAFTALALWRGLRRLGPPLPDPSLDRRSLLEHLAAAGRFQWRVRDGEALLAAAQGALHTRLWRAHPALASLPPDEQTAALAARAGLPEARVFKAMRYGRHADPREFTEALQTLERLRTLP